MAQQLSLDDVRRALAARDPELAPLLINLCSARDEAPKGPVREGALTFEGAARELTRWSYRRKKPQERARWRIDVMRALEAPGAEVPPPERIGAHAVLLELWGRAREPGAAFERDALLQVIAGVPLRWGPWRGLKQIFKEAEAAGDTEVLGALTARFDAQLSQSRGRAFSVAGGQSEVTRATLAYLCRRAWRFLRRRAEALPAAYADAAVDVLRFYPQNTNWSQTWVYNHVLHHDSKKYNRRRFRYWARDVNPLKHRAYGDLWRRTPRPLFTLLERAQAEAVRGYATSALKTDFRAMLRDVEPAWVVRLIAAHSSSIDAFVIWLLANVPKFEQSAFRELGLHDAVVRLLDSPSSEARAYAAAYARTHARDLPLERLILLANNSHADVRNLVKDLLGDRDARKEVGLDAWGRLLGTQYGHELATAALRKHFGARELTREWFSARLLDSRDKVVDFAAELLPKIHTYKDLGSAYFRALLDAPKLGRKATGFALDAVSRYPIADFDAEFWASLLLRPHSRQAVIRWIREDKVAPAALGTRFWKALAFRPTWETGEPWLDGLKKRASEDGNIAWSDELQTLAFSLLGDVRKFTPDQLGFDWLMLLVQRAEPAYHDFATEYMIKAFLPADFAPADEGAAAAPAAEEAAKTIDLGGKSFLFTGKLKTMKRDEAERKVTAAGGANAGSVTAKLDYLVIGDEGSPLYGAGRKGSKQVAAEKLIAKGAAIKIISETAFLQMLSGGVREFKADKVEAGCLRLWAMLTDPGPVDAPLARFARAYIRRHHPEIGLAATDRPVDPGAEIPASFLTWARVKALFADDRAPLRSLAVELGRWELAAWAPPLFDLVALAESPHPEVRAFVREALLADDTAELRRLRVPPERLTGDAVYAICESQHPEARALGMQLISAHPRLRIPEELFRLSESPDRSVTAFVVRTFWALYRDRGTTEGWTPPPEPPRRGLVDAAQGARGAEERPEGVGAPGRPATLPASHGALRDFMRRLLFTVPPAKPPTPPAEGEGGRRPKRVRPQPARRAKLALIEVMRDLAIGEREFAGVVAPLIKEFMGSRGQSERSACRVALARIAVAHADLDLLVKEVA